MIGWIALLVGALGLVHMANGTPGPAAGTAAIRAAGGLDRYFASAPLVAGVTAWVAAPVLALVTGFGVLVITGTPCTRSGTGSPSLRGAGAGRRRGGAGEDSDAARLAAAAASGATAIEAGDHAAIRHPAARRALSGRAARPATRRHCRGHGAAGPAAAKRALAGAWEDPDGGRARRALARAVPRPRRGGRPGRPAVAWARPR